MGKFYEGLAAGLSLYVRQSAWLNTAPRRKSKKGEEMAQPTRLAEMRQSRCDENFSPEMPEADALHVAAYLFEIGPIVSSGMGPVALSHQEIAAWSELTGIELTAWEARTLRALSREYLSEHMAAEDPNRPPPFVDSAVIDYATKTLRDAMRALDEL